MTLEELNRRDAEISAHAMRAIKAERERKRDRAETRAAINEALKARDDARGNLLRAFLRT